MAARKRKLSERATVAPTPPKPQTSSVEVEFIDGEIRFYTITATFRIGQWLAREASDTGVLTLFNDDQSVSIPISQVRTYTIRPSVEETGSPDDAQETQSAPQDADAESQAAEAETV